jgi:hypothetical protein
MDEDTRAAMPKARIDPSEASLSPTDFTSAFESKADNVQKKIEYVRRRSREFAIIDGNLADVAEVGLNSLLLGSNFSAPVESTLNDVMQNSDDDDDDDDSNDEEEPNIRDVLNTLW